MKKSCVHIAQSDGSIIPFESFNLLYRDEHLVNLDLRREEVSAAFAGRAMAPSEDDDA